MRSVGDGINDGVALKKANVSIGLCQEWQERRSLGIKIGLLTLFATIGLWVGAAVKDPEKNL